MKPDVHVLGVRHHGPGSARSVQRALDALVPDVVLVELPADSQAALAMVARDDLVPPVALLGYVPDRPDLAAFLPLARFSPEWVALRWAATHGVDVRAIDLPLAQSLAWRASRHEVLLDERDDAPVDPLGDLARAAGRDDAETWWEDVVEHRGDDAFADIADAMAALREGRTVSASDQVREAYMRTVLRQVLAEQTVQTVQTVRPRCIAVVCGAWHVPALTGELPPASHDARSLRGLPKVKVACTWVPWTHRRLAASTGYGAGVAAPGWYAHVFEHPGPRGLVRWFAEAGAALRAAGLQASPEHLIAGVRTAEALAALRDRPRPGLAEALDAAVAVLGEGRPGPLALLRDRIVVGPAIGTVPDDTPMVPLARDLSVQQKRCRLTPSAERRTVELDLRTDAGLRRSHLLHRLAALGVAWGELTEGRGSSGTFRETWELQWEPELSIALIERSGLGTTVEVAARVRLVEACRETTSVLTLVSLVESALVGDLTDVVPTLVARLAVVAANAPDLAELMDAVVPLARTARYGDVRSSDTSSVRGLVDSLIVRILGGLDLACRSLDVDSAQAMAQRLTAVQAALGLVDHPERHDGWPRALERLTRSDAVPLVAGRATRLLHDSGDWSPSRTAEQLAVHLGRAAVPADGAGFVEGFLGGGGAVLVHDADLLELLDTWIAGLDADAFEVTVPLLRRTFGAFEPSDRRRIGEMVSGRGGRPSTWWNDDLDPVRVDAALRTIRALVGVAT